MWPAALGRALAMGLVLRSGAAMSVQPPAAYGWDVPAPFPAPPVPADNPMSAAKVELGRHLFYDRRLSANGTQACASCHQQRFAFTDGRARALGSTGVVHPRGSMSLANVAYAPALGWADPRLTQLEAQALVPLLGSDPIEMGSGGREAELLTRVRGDTTYRRLVAAAYGSDSGYTIRNLVRAIASFERTLLSFRSPYDRYRWGGDQQAISPLAKAGELFFFSGQRGSCFQCHGGWNFSGAVRSAGDTLVRARFFNTGLYNLAGATSYPPPNTGAHAITGRAEDMGAFRAPTLRNIAVTAPYMHDGSVATLNDVLDHYAAGGRVTASGPNAGDGRHNPNKAPAVHGFTLSADERRAVLAFLETLTDSVFLTNPAFGDPWPASRRASPGSAQPSSSRVVAADWPSDGAPPPSVHASTMAEVNGTLTAAWFAGAYESAKDVGIWFTRFERGAWATPTEIANGVQPDGTRFPTWNPVLDAPGGSRLVLYYKVGPNPREWWGMVRESADGGRTWSAARRLPDGILGPIKNKLVRLRDGTLVSPSSTEAPDSANAWRVHFERSNDGGRTWTRTAPAPSAREVDAIQPTILVHRTGALQALVRTRGPGVLFETWSRDAGRTWSALAATTLLNPNSGIDAVTLRDGRHVLVSNPVREGRTPLVVSVSPDGVAWTPVDTLEAAPGEYSYPSIVQTRDGLVHVMYTWQRKRIRHVVLRVP